MRSYGPHCAHALCPLLDCRAGFPTTIDFPCSLQESCPSCGPNGAFWEHGIPYMKAQLVFHFGTTNAEEVRKSDRATPAIQAECLRYAELLRDHPPVRP